MQNLRDKLLKAGLVSKEQAEKATEAPKPRRENTPRREESRKPAAESRIPKLPPLALPGSKAYQRVEALKQMERDKRIRELVRAAEVQPEVGDVRFHFMTRKGKLRRLEISEAQQKLLEEGKLAVVERPEPAMIEHSLVPRETAEELLALFEKAVRFYNRDGKAIGFLSDEELAGNVSAEPEANEEGQAAEQVAQTPSADETPSEDEPAAG